MWGEKENMIHKKYKISIITFVVVLIIIIAVVLKFKNDDRQTHENPTNIKLTEIKYDEETGLYYIRDNNTEEIIYASDDENDPELQFYKENPDYNPNPLLPKSTDLSSFINYSDVKEE